MPGEPQYKYRGLYHCPHLRLAVKHRSGSGKFRKGPAVFSSPIYRACRASPVVYGRRYRAFDLKIRSSWYLCGESGAMLKNGEKNNKTEKKKTHMVLSLHRGVMSLAHLAPIEN